MKITYENKSNKFVIQCEAHENRIVMGLSDKRFRKASRTWGVPALRRNIEYMRQHMNNSTMYSEEALAIYNNPLKTPNQIKQLFPSWYKFKKFQPMKHQQVSLDHAINMDEYGLFYEQGLGKTFTTINLATAWRMNNQINAVVVVCPSSIKLVWEDELEDHCPIDHQVHAMMAGKYKKVDKFLEEPNDFKWLIVGVEALSQGGAIDYMKKFLMTHNCLMVIDESSTIKTPNKTRTDRCIDAGLLAKKRMILSGTSITQGIEDLYTQLRFLNPDIIGFNSFFTFRANYCVTMTQEVGFKNGRPITVQKIIGYQNEDELIKSISPYVTRVEKVDALDLPEKVYQKRYVEMSKQQLKVYTEMKQELFMEVGGQEYEVTTVLEQMLRLQQITGGFYPFDDGEKIIAEPIPGKNAKIEELKKVMEETQGKVVIWCMFRHEIEAVAEALRKMEIKTVQFHGGCDDTEKKFAVHSFRKDPEVKVFLATKAAARGLTLIEASTSIYYSVGYSLEDYEQSQDRIHRIGQTDPCTYIHLICPRTIDVKALIALRDKKNVAQIVYDSLKMGIQ